MKPVMSRTHHHGRNRVFVAGSPWNPIIAEQAEVLLANDDNYGRNYYQLKQRIAQGKVPAVALRRIYPSLVAESLRRRSLNLPLDTARRMAALVSQPA